MIACAGVPQRASLTVMRGWSHGSVEPLVVARAAERLSIIAAPWVSTACHLFIRVPPSRYLDESHCLCAPRPPWRRVALTHTARCASRDRRRAPPPATAVAPG